MNPWEAPFVETALARAVELGARFSLGVALEVRVARSGPHPRARTRTILAPRPTQ